jgi:2-oxoisovalerate dehydrogenase E1 component
MQLLRYPQRATETELLVPAYRAMYLARRTDDALSELFRKGLVKGTVTMGRGNEATSVGTSLPLRPGRDVVSLLHRDLAAHLIMGMTLKQVFCQYMANAASPTHGREGNVHHGNAAQRRLPMMSHLGSMLAPVVGAVWAARREDSDVVGLATIGDGGTSTGDFHESLNIASVRRVPVIFVVQNNLYAFSTPISEQYRCAQLSQRAAGYGIEGATVDGTDVWTVYQAMCSALEYAQREQLPYILECNILRLCGHAVYDKAEYVTQQEWDAWAPRDPLPRARAAVLDRGGLSEEAVAKLEQEVDTQIDAAVAESTREARPDPSHPPIHAFASATPPALEPFSATGLTNQTAVTAALDYILRVDPKAVLLGLDIGEYGSAFKTCKGLIKKYGRERVINMPLAESAITGFALGASQTGVHPVVEFQFADFVTEAITQLGLNSGTWYFRSGCPAPLLIRLPCGGGVTLGAFHSGEFDGLLSRVQGLKLLYPSTPGEMFEALVAAHFDPNPCVVFEHKLLYTRAKGDVTFDGKLSGVWRPRRHAEGSRVTVVATGAMLEVAQSAAAKCSIDADIWNPYVLCPIRLEPIIESVNRTGRLLVVQEAAESAGMANNIVSLLCQKAFNALSAAPVVVSSPDTPVPFAPELELTHRPGIDRVAAALANLCGEPCE